MTFCWPDASCTDRSTEWRNESNGRETGWRGGLNVKARRQRPGLSELNAGVTHYSWELEREAERIEEAVRRLERDFSAIRGLVTELMSRSSVRV